MRPLSKAIVVVTVALLSTVQIRSLSQIWNKYTASFGGYQRAPMEKALSVSTSTIENETEQERELQQNDHTDVNTQLQVLDRSKQWPGSEIELLHMNSNDTLIVVIVSCPYLDLVDNALESMRRTNVTNVAMVPLDETSHGVMRKLATFGVVLSVPPFIVEDQWNNSEPATYNTEAFKLLTSSRPVILREIMENLISISGGKGIGSIPTLLYSDIDTYFQYDPVPFFRESAIEFGYVPAREHIVFELNKPEPNTGRFDIVALTDNQSEGLCSCFLHLRATASTLAFLRLWEKKMKTNKFRHDQHGLKKAFEMVVKGGKRSRNNALGTSIRVYSRDNPFIPNGCVLAKMGNRSEVLVAHNQCIIGHDKKVKRFQEEWGMWRPSGRLEHLNYKCGGSNGEGQ